MAIATRTGALAPGRTIASAGEGVVLEIANRPELVGKIYHGLGSAAGLLSANWDPVERLRKVALMADNPPALRVQPDGHVVLAWPEELIFENGSAVGYTMRKIPWTQTIEMHELVKVQPGDRVPAHIPSWVSAFGWANRVHTAINLCRAVEAAHSTGAVIGDFNERNILVHATALVSLVDCDSMQFIGPDGELFACDVGHRDYTPPELEGQNLSRYRRAPEGDYFALAIHIHRLLLGGVHPFLGGRWTGEGERPPIPVLVKRGEYVGGPRSAIAPSSRHPDPTRLPKPVRALFDRAFRGGAYRPSDRPGPSEWARVLERVRVREQD
jgi:DNA-binding helix-hairpin-helix protein with protein kinase domain